MVYRGPWALCQPASFQWVVACTPGGDIDTLKRGCTGSLITIAGVGVGVGRGVAVGRGVDGIAVGMAVGLGVAVAMAVGRGVDGIAVALGVAMAVGRGVDGMAVALGVDGMAVTAGLGVGVAVASSPPQATITRVSTITADSKPYIRHFLNRCKRFTPPPPCLQNLAPN